MVSKTIKNYGRIKEGIEMYKGEMYIHGDYDDVVKAMEDVGYTNAEINFIKKEAGY